MAPRPFYPAHHHPCSNSFCSNIDSSFIQMPSNKSLYRRHRCSFNPLSSVVLTTNIFITGATGARRKHAAQLCLCLLSFPFFRGLEAETQCVQASIELFLQQAIDKPMTSNLRLAREGVRHNRNGKVLLFECRGEGFERAKQRVSRSVNGRTGANSTR